MLFMQHDGIYWTTLLAFHFSSAIMLCTFTVEFNLVNLKRNTLHL